MIRVLVLGQTGMLGSMVFDYFLKSSAFKVRGTQRKKFDVDKFLKDQSTYEYIRDYDYIINCIGIIKPFCKDNNQDGVIRAIKVNSLFPHKLCQFCNNSKVKIIQIATDCVFSGKDGRYNEDCLHDPIDVYGKTKSLGEVYFGNFLNIRCSIIGPELKNNLGLLGWFLTQKSDSKLKGFENHKWNGVTTLQFAKLIEKIIENNKFNELIKINNVFHFVPNDTVTKYKLLTIFNKVFGKGFKIQKVRESLPKDLTLKTKYNQLNDIFGSFTIEDALIELREYMNTPDYFFKY